MNSKIKIEDIKLKKPNIGLGPEKIKYILGKKIKKNLKKDIFLKLSHLK